MLLLSLACARRGRLVASAALFAALLGLKHLFLTLAPLEFVYLLRAYCFVAPPRGGGGGARDARARGAFAPARFATLAVVAGGVLGGLCYKQVFTPLLAAKAQKDKA